MILFASGPSTRNTYPWRVLDIVRAYHYDEVKPKHSCWFFSGCWFEECVNVKFVWNPVLMKQIRKLFVNIWRLEFTCIIGGKAHYPSRQTELLWIEEYFNHRRHRHKHISVNLAPLVRPALDIRTKLMPCTHYKDDSGLTMLRFQATHNHFTLLENIHKLFEWTLSMRFSHRLYLISWYWSISPICFKVTSTIEGAIILVDSTHLITVTS